jgi:uncharacterized protein YkwD
VRIKSSLTLLATAVICLAATPSALAVGVGPQRVAAPNPHTATARATATVSPLIAPPSVCPGETDLRAPAVAQEQAMRCMTDFARVHADFGELAEDPQLDASAAEKTGDVLSCDSFSHFACGREFTYWMREAGYIGEGCWHAGENLAWGIGEYGSARSIFEAWMRSPTHRRNILGEYDSIGISLAVGDLEGHAAARVWTAHFGSRCEA